MMKAITYLLLLLPLALGAAPVSAQDPPLAEAESAPEAGEESPAALEGAGVAVADGEFVPDTSGTDEEARGIFEAGSAAYSAGRFEDAQRYFTQAHDLSGRPGLLFNVGQAAQRAGDDDAAIAAYERYLIEVPEAENRPFVESSLDTLTARRREAAQQADAEQAEAQHAESASDAGSSVLPIVFFTAAGVGLAAGIIGSILSSSNKSEVESECPLVDGQYQCPMGFEGTYDAVGTWALIADIGFGLAIAGVIAGVLSVALAGDEDQPTTSASAGCGPTGCRLSLRTQF